MCSAFPGFLIDKNVLKLSSNISSGAPVLPSGVNSCEVVIVHLVRGKSPVSSLAILMLHIADAPPPSAASMTMSTLPADLAVNIPLSVIEAILLSEDV